MKELIELLDALEEEILLLVIKNQFSIKIRKTNGTQINFW